MRTKHYINELTYKIIGASIEVYKQMGRGLLESVYHECLKQELLRRKINFHTEMRIPVTYKEKILDIDFRCDVFIEKCVVV